METATIDRLFLELSQFTNAKTNREIQLEAFVKTLYGIINGNDVPKWDDTNPDHVREKLLWQTITTAIDFINS